MNNYQKSRAWYLVLSLFFFDFCNARTSVNQAPAQPATQSAFSRSEDAVDIEMARESDIDIERKYDMCKKMTLNAIRHFAKLSVANACNDFIRNPGWREGELFIFVFTADGIGLAHGDDHDLIWKNIKSIKGIGAAPLIKDMLDVGEKGGRISYLWDNGYKSAFVKSVQKNGKTYILGCGFFPESNEFTTKQLVRTAVAYFEQNGREATFALINNPTGPFVKGDIYMFVYDFNGLNVAHGNNPALVGQNLIDQVDSRGKFITRELIKIARSKGKGWLDYIWRNELKRSYVERIIDPKTKTRYVISAGYYPDVNLESVKSYVHRAISFLKANGAKVAFSEFSNIVGEFAQGGLGIMVFDFKGKNLANGENPAFVGQNMLKIKGQQGRFFIRDIIETAKKYGKAIISYTVQNADAIGYFERVETPDGKFIIGAEFFPASKTISTQTLVNRAVELLKEQKPERAFGVFSTRDSQYIHGDLNVFVYDTEGNRLVNGPRKEHIWENFAKSTDQQGKSIVSDIVQIALNGGGWAEYRVRNATRKLYVKAVEKINEAGEAQNFILGSGYFL